MFSYAYDQGFFIEMASTPLELNDLQRYPGQPTAGVQSIYCDDPFQLLLVVEKKRGSTLKQVDNYIVNTPCQILHLR